MTLRDRVLLAKLMAIDGISQPALAAAAGWKSHTSVGRLLRGEWTRVHPGRAQAIANHLKVELDVLFVPDTSTDTSQNTKEGNAA